jgi:hypothetical protein
MFKRKALIFALASMLSLPVIASVGETEHDYGTEHQELNDDLQTNLGLTVSRYADGHIELADRNGNHSSYELQATGATTAGCPIGQAVCYRDSGDGSGSVVVDYNTGRQEIAIAGSHNEVELNEHAVRLGYSIVSKTNGVLTIHHTASGGEARVRYAPQMVRGAAGLNPGIRVESNGRIVERYTDGWEQELLRVN